MEGMVSRGTIRHWLEDWERIFYGGPPVDPVLAGNSAHKSVDGIAARQLNKIMLEQAYEALPLELRCVVYYRWIKPQPLNQTLKGLGYTKDQYYYRCDKAVSSMFHYLNGDAIVL